jgi:hypothetical protein
VQPTIAQMRLALNQRPNTYDIQQIGVNEAPNVDPKPYLPPSNDWEDNDGVPPGGLATQSGLPVGGVDMSVDQPGHQMMTAQSQQPMGAPPGQPQPQATAPQLQGQANPLGQPPSNILQMTPQGQAMSAMKPPGPPGMAKGGSAKSVDEMKAELAEKTKEPTRLRVAAEGPGGVKGIVVPYHMWHGTSGVYAKGDRKGQSFFNPGMKHINEARAKVYGSENRDPLDVGKIGKIHRDTLEEHFAKPLHEQKAAEEAALNKLRAAKHIKGNADTLDESEKLDTVHHEHDEEGRSHVGFASKGVAGRALYTSGHGKNAKSHVLNTCPGQTEGCGGGLDEHGYADTLKGTCFAPNAEQQYVNAAVRRACHEQAKHDPAMTRDWILAHTGSLRKASRLADNKNKRLLFRPNVVDETDTSSRHVIRHLNEQRKAVDKPPIIANSYGKTNELHDPENGYYVTHSNVGPKVKHGKEVSENISRDKGRVSNTVLAENNKGDFVNEQGNKTPPKGSYLVTDVKRGSPMSKKMEEHITHAKYWGRGNEVSRLSKEEREEGPEGHFGPNGKPTTPEKAHYGHTTIVGKDGEARRYDYQKQHVLHPRLVNVPERKENKKTGKMETVDHMIPTDSRFMDTEFLPKNRFKSKNGKEVGHILMTTPTESTSNVGHETSFTHNVSQKHIDHAIANNGEYEVDPPHEQEAARGKEYVAPQPIKMVRKAEGGSIGGRHPGLSDDDFHAFPESNIMAQRHLAMRRGDDEERPYKAKSSKVAIHKDLDTMRLELTKRK